jgi:hypothetical protein
MLDEYQGKMNKKEFRLLKSEKSLLYARVSFFKMPYLLEDRLCLIMCPLNTLLKNSANAFQIHLTTFQ